MSFPCTGGARWGSSCAVNLGLSLRWAVCCQRRTCGNPCREEGVQPGRWSQPAPSSGPAWTSFISLPVVILVISEDTDKRCTDFRGNRGTGYYQRERAEAGTSPVWMWGFRGGHGRGGEGILPRGSAQGGEVGIDRRGKVAGSGLACLFCLQRTLRVLVAFLSHHGPTFQGYDLGQLTSPC